MWSSFNRFTVLDNQLSPIYYWRGTFSHEIIDGAQESICDHLKTRQNSILSNILRLQVHVTRLQRLKPSIPLTDAIKGRQGAVFHKISNFTLRFHLGLMNTVFHRTLVSFWKYVLCRFRESRLFWGSPMKISSPLYFNNYSLLIYFCIVVVPLVLLDDTVEFCFYVFSGFCCCCCPWAFFSCENLSALGILLFQSFPLRWVFVARLVKFRSVLFLIPIFNWILQCSFCYLKRICLKGEEVSDFRTHSMVAAFVKRFFFLRLRIHLIERSRTHSHSSGYSKLIVFGATSFWLRKK